MSKKLTAIGRMELAGITSLGYVNVPAKIDTGAHSSSIGVKKLWVDHKHFLHFVVDNPKHNMPKNHYKFKDYKVKIITSSNGASQVRYSIHLDVVINNKVAGGDFTLSNRKKNTFPILIGSTMLEDKFIVDVTKDIDRYKEFVAQNKPKTQKRPNLLEIAKKNPLLFYKKYYKKYKDKL